MASGRTDDWDPLEGMARALVASGRYKVVRRFERRRRYAVLGPEATKLGVYVDVETTGLDPEADAIIEFAVVPFEFCGAGRIYAVGEPVSFFEDPGRPLPRDIVELTGITDEMVAGQRIDDAAVLTLLEGAVLVVAHNAEFDRKFVERRLPAFASRHWACSQREVPWHRHGCRGTKLDYILFRLCAEFHEGHRAADDCLAALHALATPGVAGEYPFAALLASAREPTFRVWAVDAPRTINPKLKARRYKFNDGKNGRPTGWFRDVRGADREAEEAWLRATAFGGATGPAIPVERFTAKERYSARM